MRCSTCGSDMSARRMRLHRGLVLGVLATGALLAYGLTGSLLGDIAEGNDRTTLALWKVVIPLVMLLTGVLLAVVRVSRPACPTCASADGLVVPDANQGTSRRTVLRAGGSAIAATVGGGALAVTHNREWLPVAKTFFGKDEDTIAPAVRPEWAGARIQRTRRLGRTDVMVSDVSVGCGRLKDPKVARLAVERGVTYFDTSPDYADTASEQALGAAIRGLPRDRLFLATKFCRPEGHLRPDVPVPEVIASVEQSLRRLGTDYVDLIHVHSCDQVERLMAENIHEAFDRLKQQGKARFLGVSTHTPNLEAVANAAIDSKRFDVMMLAYHYGMWPSFGHVLAKAHEHDVGIVAMKTLKGARHEQLDRFRGQEASYAQAAFRWVLSNPDVACLVVSFWEERQVDEYLVASGTSVTPQDLALLDGYDAAIARDYCQPHCGVCLPACPEELPIHDILRYRMYAKDYHWPEEGRRQYAKLAKNVSTCLSCPAPCAGACPHGIPIRTALLDAHRVLTS